MAPRPLQSQHPAPNKQQTRLWNGHPAVFQRWAQSLSPKHLRHIRFSRATSEAPALLLLIACRQCLLHLFRVLGVYEEDDEA